MDHENHHIPGADHTTHHRRQRPRTKFARWLHRVRNSKRERRRLLQLIVIVAAVLLAFVIGYYYFGPSFTFSENE